MDGKLRYSYSTLGLYWHDFDGDVKVPLEISKSP
jgi:hypothetical protein